MTEIIWIFELYFLFN